MRNLTSAAANARNRSTKSGVIDAFSAKFPQLAAEPPHLKDALGI
jgi:hypothetical protein